MITYRLPCSLVLIYNTTVEIIVTACKDIEGSEHLEAHFVTILDEISEHVIIYRSLDSFPVTHVRSDLTLIKNFSHYGLDIDNDIAETKILAFRKIILNRIRMRKGCIVRLTIKPHVIMVRNILTSL